MKIYNPKPTPVVRLQIMKAGQKTQYLTLCETTRKKVITFCKNLLRKQNISPFVGGKKTSIYVRSAKGAKNLKSESVSFYGLDTETVYDLIVNELNKSL